MIIQSIRISNILSFEQKDNIDDCQEIIFNDNLNIVIGPNGAGKSNFLEIINHIFRNGLFHSSNFNANQISEHKKNSQVNLKDTITVQNRTFSLPVNHGCKNNQQQIKLKIKLSFDDKNNLKFIQNYKDKFNEYLKKYVNQDIVFGVISEDEFSKCNEIELFLKNSNSNQIEVQPLSLPVENYVITYLKYFNILQNLILLVNEEENEKWEILKNTFALISGYRNYNSVNLNFTIHPNKQNTLQGLKLAFLKETTRNTTNDEPPVFSYVTSKIAYSYYDLLYSNDATSKDLIAKLNDETFIAINKILQKIMKLKLDISIPNKYDKTGFFQFIDTESDKIVNPSELSAGEKGIIHFIFSIYGYEIRNGVMVIDEPELHLHPQLQTKYLDILKSTSIQENIQFIIATHSPIFVTSESIEGVVRFYKNDDGFTQIARHSNITKDEKDKIQMLNYINSAKIFFSKKVILVEGDSDHFFFQKYFQNFKLRKNIETSDIEFLNMGSADRYQKWYELLQNFKIKTYYIGDLDNMLRKNISNNAEPLKQLVGTLLLFSDLEQLKLNHLSEYEKLMLEISEKYSRNIFLLCYGSMEDYYEKIKMVRGNPDRILNFCNNEFDNWMNNSDNLEIKNEIDYFFHCIVNSN